MPIKDPVKRARAQKRWRVQNADHWRAYRQNYMRNYVRSRAAILEALKDRPCADCGGEFPSYVMDFDHNGLQRQSKKSFNTRVKFEALEPVLAEASRCDVVYANCHRVRSHGERQMQHG